MKTFLIGANDAGQRLDKFLTKAVPLLPQPLLYKYIRLKRIKRNKKRCEISTRLQEGDVLELRFGERTVKVEVLVVAEHMGKTEAAAMYREIL